MAFFKLKDNFLLRGWDLLPWAVVDTNSGRAVFLKDPKQMEALELCNGRINLDLPLIDPEVRALVPELVKNGVVEECEPGDSIRPEQKYRRHANRYIRTAHWSITGRCNYRCRHCYMSAPDAKYGELDHATVMSMIDELAECGVAQVSLTGGEPLVRGDFLEIVDALLERGIRITTIYSNGKLVNEKLLKSLDERGIHPEFNMSYDAPGWHDWLRGVDGAEEAVERAFRLCREAGFPTGAEMCIHAHNKHLLRETVLRLAELGCWSLKTNPVADAGAWREGGYGESVPLDELFRLYLDYIPAYYEDGMPLSIMLGGAFSADPDNPDEWDMPLYRYPVSPARCVVCNHARMVMYISAEGRTLPCLSLSGMDIQEEFPLIPEIGLAKCLSDSRYMDFINTRADVVLAHNPECNGCEYAPWCQGGCRASGLEGSDQTDLLRADPACCKLYKGGWAKQLLDLMRTIRPDADSGVQRDEGLMKLLDA